MKNCIFCQRPLSLYSKNWIQNLCCKYCHLPTKNQLYSLVNVSDYGDTFIFLPDAKNIQRYYYLINRHQYSSTQIDIYNVEGGTFQSFTPNTIYDADPIEWNYHDPQEMLQQIKIIETFQ